MPVILNFICQPRDLFTQLAGAPNENIVQNHLNIAVLNVF